MLLFKIGFYKSGPYKIGLNRIEPKDVFIASYPKSGNTWVRFLLANMLEGDKEITLKNINNYVPGIYNFRKEIDKKEGRRYLKTHDSVSEMYPKTIYIYRDYRDVLVSYYHFQVAQNQFKGTMSDFIRNVNTQNPFGTWKDHVQKALKFQKKEPSRILLLGYEQLLNNPIDCVKKIASFCEIRPSRSIQEIVSNCSFESLKKVENKYGKVFDNNELVFFRSGQKNQWKELFSDEDLALVMKDNKETLMQLGYETV